MFGIEFIILGSCVIITLVFARISNSANPPKWLESDGLVGLIIGTLTSGILFSIAAFVVTAEELTGSKFVDSLLGLVVLIGVCMILALGTRNGRLAKKAK